MGTGDGEGSSRKARIQFFCRKRSKMLEGSKALPVVLPAPLAEHSPKQPAQSHHHPRRKRRLFGLISPDSRERRRRAAFTCVEDMLTCGAKGWWGSGCAGRASEGGGGCADTPRTRSRPRGRGPAAGENAQTRARLTPGGLPGNSPNGGRGGQGTLGKAGMGGEGGAACWRMMVSKAWKSILPSLRPRSAPRRHAFV